MSQLTRGLMIAALFACVGAVHAQPVPPKASPDHALKSTPQTIVWGYLAADIPPALTIRSGQTVRIDTVSHQGVVNMTDPVTFFSRAGIPREQVLQDAIDIYAKAPHPDGSARMCSPGRSMSRTRSPATCSRCASISSTIARPMASTMRGRAPAC